MLILIKKEFLIECCCCCTKARQTILLVSSIIFECFNFCCFIAVKTAGYPLVPFIAWMTMPLPFLWNILRVTFKDSCCLYLGLCCNLSVVFWSPYVKSFVEVAERNILRFCLFCSIEVVYKFQLSVRGSRVKVCRFIVAVIAIRRPRESTRHCFVFQVVADLLIIRCFIWFYYY